MGKAWKVAKAVLGLRMCTWSSAAVEDADDFYSDDCESSIAQSCPNTPARFSSPRSSLRVSKGTCPICLEAIKSGAGQAVFTSECSHTFHFSCIASNVMHGSMVCPVCRAKWKEVPWNGSATPPPPRQSPRRFVSARSSPLRTPRAGATPDNQVFQFPTLNSVDSPDDDPVIRIIDESIASVQANRSPPQSPTEPLVYDDDEAPAAPAESSSSADRDSNNGNSSNFRLKMNLHAEVGSVSYCEPRNSFNVLVHLKAPESAAEVTANHSSPSDSPVILDPSQRAPIDLVTVLDVSGSMAGTKLILLKRAMAFVIRNLSSRDRLSVVVFSSSAKRLFPLRPMSEEGRQSALRAIDTLVCTGGTNIAEGLKKGGKVLEERQFKNPVASIMLLSDGQDTYSMGTRGQVFSYHHHKHTTSRLMTSGNGTRVPVHTFGFGADHDAATMHSISQLSGGTFSFIQAEGGVQDAFAQCVGGLLSVVVQDVELVISAQSQRSKIKRVLAGSYSSSVSDDTMRGVVKLGDLYADEERDVLVEVELPVLEGMSGESLILDVGCTYTEPVHRGVVSASRGITVDRPEFVSASQQRVSVDVDRQKNRLVAAKAISEAGSLAEAGEMEGAQRVLRSCQVQIQGSVAVQAGDRLSMALEGELGEIQVRIANRQLYERCGRAYILSAQSSHLTQRATTRGHYNSVEDYQTPSMTGMILRSHQHLG